jgi:mannose-6-phosphate isomerase-like protein (cupin superfamily)
MEDALLDMAYGREELAIDDTLALKLDLLPLLAEHLSKDLPLVTLENFETILKAILRANLRDNVSGEVAREVAEFQKETGLLFKYKPYAIKCASPLGYSIFLQNAGQGFSFQRHVTHKTEVFHILDVQPGGYVFICDFQDWDKCYDTASFADWLAGNADERYDRFRYQPQPGDVFTIKELGIVHTVIGCVLEEFATVSTDMVERLHDQNHRGEIPSHFNRGYVQERLSEISLPSKSRLVNNCSPDAPEIEELQAEEIPGGHLTRLAETALVASRYVIEARGASELFVDEERASSIFIAEGAGRVIIADEAEAKRTSPPSIAVSAGDVLMIPAGLHYGFVNEDAAPLKLSEQRISFDVAFL